MCHHFLPKFCYDNKVFWSANPIFGDSGINTLSLKINQIGGKREGGTWEQGGLRQTFRPVVRPLHEAESERCSVCPPLAVSSTLNIGSDRTLRRDPTDDTDDLHVRSGQAHTTPSQARTRRPSSTPSSSRWGHRRPLPRPDRNGFRKNELYFLWWSRMQD